MRGKVLCFVCCLAILFSGCTATNIPDLATEESLMSELPSSQAGGLHLPPIIGNAEANSGKVNPDNPDVSAAINSIMRNAPEMSVFAIIANPESEVYNSLGKPELAYSTIKSLPGSSPETVFITTFENDVQIVIEHVEYNQFTNDFDVLNGLYYFNAEAGKHYELTAHMPEDMPQVRVTALWGGREASWYCSGIGEHEEVYYFSFYDMEEFAEENQEDYIWTMSGAAAVSYVLHGDYAFWESVAQTVSLLLNDGKAYVTLSSEELHHYVEALNFGYTAWPELIEEIVYNEATDTYNIEYLNYYPELNWEIWDYGDNADGSGFVVLVAVTSNVNDAPVICETSWIPNPYTDSPFELCIAQVSIPAAVG